MELGGCWSQGLNSGPSARGARAPGHGTHLSMNGAVVSGGFSAANIGAGDLRREGRSEDRGWPVSTTRTHKRLRPCHHTGEQLYMPCGSSWTGRLP